MATSASSVSFLFQLREMMPSDEHSPRSFEGEWAPPRRLGSNTIRTRANSGQWYRFDGSRGTTTACAPPRHHAAESLHFRTYSFYHNDGTLWVYNNDATRYRVGDGTHSSDDEDDENSEYDEDSSDADATPVYDWARLGFAWLQGYGFQTSFAAFRQEHERLCVRRPDQLWVDQIIPENHTPQRTNTAPGFGCLLSQIPIMIALIAFSVHPNHVHYAFTRCMGNHYRTNGLRPGIQGPQGWIDQRGAVIRVFFTPEEFDALMRRRGNDSDAVRQQLHARLEWFETNHYYFL